MHVCAPKRSTSCTTEPEHRRNFDLSTICACMASPVRGRRKRKLPHRGDLMAKLADIVFSGLSWTKWRQSRGTDVHDLYRNELTALKTELLQRESLQIFRTASAEGAFVPFYPLVVRLLQYLLSADLLTLPGHHTFDTLYLKISLDGRKVLGHKNVGWTVSFPSIESGAQSPHHQHLFAIANMSEPDLRTSGIWGEMGLAADLLRLRTTPVIVGERALVLDAIVVADWKTLVYVMGFSVANTKSQSARVCGWCSVSKGYLNAQWYQFTEVHRAWPIEACAVGSLPQLSASHVRYCAMHGCNRLLDNSLQLIARLVSVDLLLPIVRQACHKWEPRGRSGRFQCYEMKHFWERKLDAALTAAVALHPGGRVVLLPTRAETWSVPRMVKELLAACRTYFEFSYTPTPAGPAYTALTHAACVLLSITASLAGRMPPTTHYLTSHFLQFAHTDRGAYHTLQEGPEHHHKFDMDVAHQTFSNWQGAHVPYTRMEQVLRTYQLRQILLEHGYGPNTSAAVH